MPTHFDQLIAEIGELGHFQKRAIACYACIFFVGFWRIQLSLFLVPLVNYRCAIPSESLFAINSSLKDDSFLPKSQLLKSLLNETVPYYYVNKTCQHEYSKCSRTTSNTPSEACSEWVFDKSTYSATAFEDFSMVCGQTVYRTLTLMGPLAGMLMGSIFCGLLADRFGRRTIILLMVTLDIITSLLCSWSPNFAYFLGYRIIGGATMIGYYMSIYVLCIELTGASKRMWISVVASLTGTLSGGSLPAIAYGIRNWHYLSLATSVAMIAILPAVSLLPESPRWLLTKGRHSEAMEIIHKIAKHNKTVVPERFKNMTNLLDDVTKKGSSETNDKLWHLLKTPRLAFRSFVIVLNWVACTVGFYGITFNLGTFTSNPFLNFFLVTIIGLPGFVIIILLADRIGRRRLHASVMITGGVALLCSIFPVVFRNTDVCHSGDLDPAALALSLVGKLGVNLGFSMIYIFSSELLPTSVRNSGMGFSSMVARCGGIAAPFISQLNIEGKFGSAFPLMVFGIITLVAGLLSLALPETLNHDLPDTVDEANAFGRKRRASKVIRSSVVSVPQDIEMIANITH